MKSLLSAPRTINRRGFTLVELTLAGSLLGVVGLLTFGVLRSGAILSGQNTGINVSASRARLAIDQIGERARYATDTPSLITAAGATVTGTTADGIIVKKFVGAPYVVKESGGTTADIVATAKVFCVEFAPGLPAPAVGDWMLVESQSRPELEISAVATLSNSGGVLRRQVTTVAAIGEVARPAYYRVGATVYRKEAYVFAPGPDPTRFELRHFSRVTSSTNFSTASNYVVDADSYRRLGGATFFTNSVSNTADVTTLRILVDSSAKQEYVARQKTSSTYTSVPLTLRLWSLNR